MKQTLRLSSDSCSIEVAAHLLKGGELVAFPTETVYGLGAALFLEEAVLKIFQAKNRPSDNPLIAHICQIADVEKLAVDIPSSFYLLAKVFFPGPLTLVLKKNPLVPSSVSNGRETIALRMPSHPVAREFIEKAGQPLVAPSANLSGKPSATTAEHVLHDFDGKIAAVIDGGPCSLGLESTVLSLVDKPLLLRPGSIKKEALEQVLGQCISYATKREDLLASPGTRYRHYAPQAKVVLKYSEKELLDYQNHSSKKIYTFIPTPVNLYATLRFADSLGVEEIHVYCTQEVLSNEALMNRLEKAAEKA